jgi:hypothetical protein
MKEITGSGCFGYFPAAWQMAAASRAVLRSSSPVVVSRRLTGMPAARLADNWRMRRSPPYLDKFIPANHLKAGEQLKTPNGILATAEGGTVPSVHVGWMWDLTIPGNGDHDFYVVAGSASILVHNNDGKCGVAGEAAGDPGQNPAENPNPGALKKLSDSQAKRIVGDPHEFKEGYAFGPVSHFDIYVDMDSDYLFLIDKNGGEPIPTYVQR